jgi:hypothetical protein
MVRERGMSGRGRSSTGWRSWVYAGAGFTATLGLACAPGLPFAVDRWPAGGAFGVFTWAAWFVSTALAVTLALVGTALRVRDRLPLRRGGTRRLLLATMGFALLAALAYATAAHAATIEGRPLAALGLVVVAMTVLRTLALAASKPTSDADADVPAGATADRSPSSPGSPEASRPRPAPRGGDPEEVGDAEEPAGPPRWLDTMATVMAGLLVLIVALETAVSWLGPGLGLVLTTQHPAPIFWGDTMYFEYDAKKRAKADVAEYLRPPTPDSADAARRAVLPAGTRLAIKDWVENGAQVRVERDPTGRLVGEWGYVRYSDTGE